MQHQHQHWSQGALVALSARCLFVLSQAHQHLAEALLARTRSTSLLALPAHINQFGDALPASAARGGVVPAGHELLGLLARLGNSLLLLVVIVVIEVVDVLLCLFDGLGLLGGKLLGPLGVGSIAILAPLLDDLWLFLLLGGGGGVA